MGEERGPESERRENDHRQRRVDRALSTLDQVRSAHLPAGEGYRGRPGRHEKRDPEGQLTNEDHARCSARLYPGVFLYFSGAFS